MDHHPQHLALVACLFIGLAMVGIVIVLWLPGCAGGQRRCQQADAVAIQRSGTDPCTKETR